MGSLIRKIKQNSCKVFPKILGTICLKNPQNHLYIISILFTHISDILWRICFNSTFPLFVQYFFEKYVSQLSTCICFKAKFTIKRISLKSVKKKTIEKFQI